MYVWKVQMHFKSCKPSRHLIWKNWSIQCLVWSCVTGLLWLLMWIWRWSFSFYTWWSVSHHDMYMASSSLTLSTFFPYKRKGVSVAHFDSSFSFCWLREGLEKQGHLNNLRRELFPAQCWSVSHTEELISTSTHRRIFYEAGGAGTRARSLWRVEPLRIR